MQIFSVGSNVIIGGSITAQVLEVLIRSNSVQYKVSWWVNNERRVEWVEECEVSESIRSSRFMQIGFKDVS